MMYSVRARAQAALTRVARAHRVLASRTSVQSHAAAVLTSSSHSSLGGAPVAAAPMRSFAVAAAGESTGAAAAAAPADEDGRQSAPADPEDVSESQGQRHEQQGEQVDAKPQSILDVDPYPPERLAALEKRYEWLDFNAMAHHMHMSDVHFFDQEVPYVDQDFTIKPDFRLLHRLEGANRLKRLQEHEDKKIHRLLHFGFWVTSGRNVRVATEGKIQSVWTMVIGGDMNGTASFGFGKGEDMIIAEKRALQDLRRNMLFVPMFESRTISHEIRGRHGVCQVRMWPRPRERGMTAGLIPRMVFECFGISDITAKVDGRALPHHQVMAIFNGLREVKSLREEAIRRGVTAHRMFERGLQQPRHPGREELHRRGNEVASMLSECKALQVHERMLTDLGVNKMIGKKETFWSYPEFGSNGAESSPDRSFIPAYIDRKPDPIDLGPRFPSPPHPRGRKPAIKNTLFKFRGLPHPRPTPRTQGTDKIL